jgi:hypothetical protein
MLLVPRCPSALARLRVFPSEDIEDTSAFKSRRSIGNALVVDQQRESDARFFPKLSGIYCVAQSDGRKLRTRCLKVVLMFTQLRDVLPAEDSAIVAQENNHRWMLFPKRAQPDFSPARIG